MSGSSRSWKSPVFGVARTRLRRSATAAIWALNSSRVADKFKLSGLTRGAASVVDAPTVEESPIHCECRVIGSLEVPPVRKLFVAEVVATTAVEGAVDDGGRLIVPSVDFFGMTAGSGEHYTMGRRVGNIGMTVGRSDIKY